MIDPLQHRLARISLEIAGRHGFVLGGGHVIEMYGMGTRPSEDIDLFSDLRGSPGEVAERSDFTVDVLRQTADLVQMTVADRDGYACKVDLGVFCRARLPVLLEIGPVLHPNAVAGKMDALFNRWAPRDFLDIHAILASGRYTSERLLEIAAEHNPGFDRQLFAETLSYLYRIPDRDFTPYGATEPHIRAMRERFAEWERELSQ